jgi:gliding motility-associated-like protein
MKKALLILLPICFLTLSVFAQNDEKSTVIGNLGEREFALNVCADAAGNKYIGGESDYHGLVIKQNAANAIVWSKEIFFTSTFADDVSIDFLDVVGDTVFGCGKIFNIIPFAGQGAFYFKMNAQNGSLYWSKFETGGQNYLSCMRYSNGKFFLVGGSIVGQSYHAGRVLAVSSQTGNVIWQNAGLQVANSFSVTGGSTIFMSATEMVNGKLFITGTGVFNNVPMQRPILIGVNDNGTVFLRKYFDVPGAVFPSDEYHGQRIEYDQDGNLIIIVSDYQIANTLDPFFLKCDSQGNVLFAKRYGSSGFPFKCFTYLHETPTHYVVFGSLGGSAQKLYAVKTLKNGTMNKSVSISKPNVYYYTFTTGGLDVFTGNSTFINGLHYFPATQSTTSAFELDINYVVLDENLDAAGDDCSEVLELPFVESDVPVTSTNMVLNTYIAPLTFTAGAFIQDNPFTAPCNGISLNTTTQNTGCQTTITATITGFTDPTFYWSTGATGSVNSVVVSTSDTVFVRVLDIKCCELIDTIIPFPSSVPGISLPEDTTVCLPPGSSFTIVPILSGPNFPVNYLWNTGSSGASLTITQSGTYWLEVSDNCFTQRDSIVVTLNSPPVIANAVDTAVCDGNFPILLDPVIPAGTVVSWENGSVLVPRSIAGPGVYTITASNGCGTVSEVISVTQINLPNAELVPVIDTCIPYGESISLVPVFNGTNSSILWSDGSTENQLAVFNSGFYTVYESNSCGIDSASCSVTINYLPEMDLPAVLDTCFEIGVGFSYTVQGLPGSYQWSSGSQTATEWISQEGIYHVTLTNICGSITDSMQVNRLIPPDLYFPEDSVQHCQKLLPVSWLHIETNFDLEILAPYQISAMGNFATESGWYTVHAFHGCWHKWDSIYVDLEEPTFYLPNSFTPNADGNNDRFEFKGENIAIRDVRIFNRWGEEIFTESGSFTGWDGSYLGETCPDGIYAVSLIYEDCFGMPAEFNGHVNLIR